jgi:hypothetical protein
LLAASEEVHHACYGKGDIIGEHVFPVCCKCHDKHCHSQENWIVDRADPVWGNHNTAAALERLKLGYQLLAGVK